MSWSSTHWRDGDRRRVHWVHVGNLEAVDRDSLHPSPHLELEDFGAGLEDLERAVIWWLEWGPVGVAMHKHKFHPLERWLHGRLRDTMGRGWHRTQTPDVMTELEKTLTKVTGGRCCSDELARDCQRSTIDQLG